MTLVAEAHPATRFPGNEVVRLLQAEHGVRQEVGEAVLGWFASGLDKDEGWFQLNEVEVVKFIGLELLMSHQVCLLVI